MQNSFISVLKHKDFKHMWFSQVFSQLALNMLTFALVLHLFDITGRAMSISLVMISTAIPVAIFGPISGLLADKINYKKILFYTNIIRFVVAILLLFARENILAYLEIMFMISALSQIFTPAESSSIPLIVPQNKLINANSLVMTTSYITLLLGYSAAGPIMALLGSKILFLISAVLYLIASWNIYSMSEYDPKSSRRFSMEIFARGLDHVWAELVFVFAYLKKNRKILNPMLKLTIGWVVIGSLITLLPAYSKSVLNIDPKYASPLIIGPAGAGMLLAIWFMNKKYKLHYEKLINDGFVIFSFAIMIFSTYYFYHGFFLSKLLMYVALIVMGFGSSLVQVSAQTLLHLNSEEDKRGRIFGLSSMQLRLATTLPALFVGAISDLTSPLVTMLILSVTIFIYSLILIFEE